MGKGAFPETHELHFGWPGMHGAKWSNLAMNTCDVLVAIGARFDDRVTGKLAAFAPGATVVHLDIDPAEISKLREADIPVVGPLAQAVQALAGEVARHRDEGTPAPHAWLDQIRAWRDEFPLRYGSSDEWLKPQTVVETLQRLTAGTDVIVTTGVGQHQMWAMQYIVTERPRNFITSGGLGTMGYGIPAAIGAKAARPEATVVCVDGDGCFQMTAQELVTAVLDDLPIVVVLINNGYLGMVTQWQDMFFDGRRSHVHLTAQVPDYAKLAEAYGGVGIVVESEDELGPALEAASGRVQGTLSPGVNRRPRQLYRQCQYGQDFPVDREQAVDRPCGCYQHPEPSCAEPGNHRSQPDPLVEPILARLVGREGRRAISRLRCACRSS